MEHEKPSCVIELTADNALKLITSFPHIMIVDFYAEWCGPCKAMAPMYEELAQEYKDMYAFAKVNIDHCPAVAQEYRIVSIPTIGIFSSGKLIDRVVGQISKEDLIAKIKKALSLPQDLKQLDQETLNDKLFQAIQTMAPVDEIKRILDAGANVNVVSAQGFTPLMFVIIMLVPQGFDVADTVQLLVSRGAHTQFIFAQNQQPMEAHDYVMALLQRSQRTAQNCEKIAEVLKKETA